jgi:MazG family protein
LDFQGFRSRSVPVAENEEIGGEVQSASGGEGARRTPEEDEAPDGLRLGSDQEAGVLDRALSLVAFLRRNCPWDASQTAESLIPHLLEESHEVVDAIRAGNHDELEGELGDLLLNLAFQVVVGEEEEHFTRESVTARLEQKMMRRHPHLFGLGEKEEWEAMKARERSPDESTLDGLASGLDPLLEAHRIQDRVSGVGFDWDDPSGAWEKVAEELEEVRVALMEKDPEALEEELGDLLFSVVNLTRLAGAHSDTLLARANRKFRGRFRKLEELARDRGIVLGEAPLQVLDELWDELKRRRAGGTEP